MKKLTELFGEHFEYLGEYCKTDARITQNPAFRKSIRNLNDCNSTYIVLDPECHVYLSDFYDYDVQHDNQQDFFVKGQSVLTVTPEFILCSELLTTESESVGMIKFHVDTQRYLHAKHMKFDGEKVRMIHHIYDEYGVELQRDCLTSVAPKTLVKSLSMLKDDSKGDARLDAVVLRVFFLQFQFDCTFGKVPVYKKSKRSSYQGYRRDMKNPEIVHVIQEDGFCFRDRLDLRYGLSFMYMAEQKPTLASKEELADAIALEENEETRNALISYCASRGITKDKVPIKKA